MYDIIGDIHGHADELVTLLEQLGYREQNACFRHPSRKVIFCGDFVDRGPHIPDVVRIARKMVEQDAALAVMGNHEFNALAFHTPDPNRPGEFLRRHSEKNVRQHAATRSQFDTAELQSALEWFATLPTSLELDGLRVVHACWSDADHEIIRQALPDSGSMNAEFLQRATSVGDEVFHAIECVLKGPELPLPDGVTVTDKEGNQRRRIRIRWFEPAAGQTWKTYSLPVKRELSDDPIPADAPAVPYGSKERPVFVGHYWLPDATPAPLADNIACLDYSVAKHGMLCAYRFDGERTLRADRFVAVPSRDAGPTS